MPNPVVHFEIMGPDGPALQNFYRELFGWKVDPNNEWQYGMVETGGEGGINGGIAGNPDGAAGGRVTVYAAVDDLQAYLDKVERLGAKAVTPVTDVVGTAGSLSGRPPGCSAAASTSALSGGPICSKGGCTWPVPWSASDSSLQQRREAVSGANTIATLSSPSHADTRPELP